MAEHSNIRAVNAYVLIKTKPGTQQDVAHRLRETLGNALVVVVDGSYDIVVSLEADAEEYVTAAVHDHVSTADGVESADVLFWIDPDQIIPVRGQEVSSPE